MALPGYPLRVVWNPAVASVAWPAFVDHAVAYFATNGHGHSYDVVQVLESPDEDEEGVILDAVDPYRTTERYRVLIRLIDDRGTPAALVWSIEKL